MLIDFPCCLIVSFMLSCSHPPPAIIVSRGVEFPDKCMAEKKTVYGVPGICRRRISSINPRSITFTAGEAL